MIPRYAPTYEYGDLMRSFNRSRDQNVGNELAERLKKMYAVKHAFLMDSGKLSISVLLKAYDRVGAVLTPAYNCIAVPQAVEKVGYRSIFVDARPGKLNVDVDDFVNAITPEVTVLMPVHLFGVPWHADRLQEARTLHDLLVAEDAAPAFGARLNGKNVGSYSDAFIVSFHWTKPLSAETGGALLTNDDQLARRVETILAGAVTPNDRLSMLIRTWNRKSITRRGVYGLTQRGYRILNGEDMYEVVPKETDGRLGEIRRMSPFASALVLEQLDRLDWVLARRQAVADIYRSTLEGLDNVILPDQPDGSKPSWIQYPIMVKNKSAFYKHMQRNGVDVTWSYRYSCPETYSDICCNNSNQIASSIIGLPTYPTLSDEDAARVGRLAKDYFTRESSAPSKQIFIDQAKGQEKPWQTKT